MRERKQRPKRAKRTSQKITAVDKLWVNKTRVKLSADQMNQVIAAVIQYTNEGLARGVSLPTQVRQVLVQLGVSQVAEGDWNISANDKNNNLNIVVTRI